MKKNIAIIATLDTKGEEVAYIKGLLETQGDFAILIDVAPLGPPTVEPDYSNEEVAQLGGRRLENLLKREQRDEIMAAMGEGAANLLTGLLKDSKMDGVLGLGGNQGSAMAAMAMKALPIGFPKFLVSTVASGDIRPYVGNKDIAVMFSVSDLVGGPNPVARSILKNAASALLGMVNEGEAVALTKGERTVAISALGNTQPAVERAMHLLREKGFKVIAFHASGAGGSAMEELIEDGIINYLLDLTPHELSEEIVGVGAYVPVHPGRMTAAGRKGIPQVVSTGALEYLCFGPMESIPSRFRRRKIYMHNPYNANVRVSRKEMAAIGEVMAERLNDAKGPTVVLVPMRGWSIHGREGHPLHDSHGDRILLNNLKRHLKKDIRFEQVDAHINDTLFAERCVDVLIGLTQERKI